MKNNKLFLKIIDFKIDLVKQIPRGFSCIHFSLGNVCGQNVFLFFTKNKKFNQTKKQMSYPEVGYHKERLDKKSLKLASILTFLIGFGQSVLIYVMSAYFSQATGTNNVGIFYLIAYVFEIFILFNLHKLVSSLGHTRAFLFVIFARIPILVLLTMLEPSFWGAMAMMSYVIVSNVSWVVLDMIVESCSLDKVSGRIRGINLTILNVGFIFGPFVSTRVLENFGYHGIFLVMIILYSAIFAIALLGLRNFNHFVNSRSGFFEILKKVANRQNIRRIYYVSFALEFFYALMVIYTPLYLQSLGFGWDRIGIIFTFMLIPFVILQFPVGYLADKRIGEKEMIIFSLFIMSFSVGAVYFVESRSALVWSAVMFMTRIGAAGLEILRDSYFYKRIDKNDIDLIDFFRTTRPAAYIIGAIFSTVILFFFPLKTIFLLVSAVAFLAIFPAWSLIDNKSEKENSSPV